MKYFAYILFLLLPVFAKGQDPYSETETILLDLFSRLSTASNDEERLGVNDTIRSVVGDYAETDSVFSHSFTSLRYLGQITSPDSLLKIISWNIILSGYSGKYFTYIIRKGEGGEKNKVITLEAPYSDRSVQTDRTYTGSDWYGALYYAVKSYLAGSERYWVVLGLDYGNPEVTKKIIDVISFNDNDSIVFGKKLFESPEGTIFRKVFEYAATGMMTLRFNTDTSIVFDHLVPIASGSGNRVYYGPDYSFDAYVFDNGTWKFRLNIDVRNRE